MYQERLSYLLRQTWSQYFQERVESPLVFVSPERRSFAVQYVVIEEHFIKVDVAGYVRLKVLKMRNPNACKVQPYHRFFAR
jgi:hypothetical protein